MAARVRRILTSAAAGGVVAIAALLAAGPAATNVAAADPPVTHPAPRLDTRFGRDGRLDVGLKDANTLLDPGAVQPDGKLVCTGWRSLPSSPFLQGVLVRFDAMGRPDARFGKNGRIVAPEGAVLDAPVLVMPDGALITGATALSPRPGSGVKAVMLRCTGSGTLDAGFGTGGVATIPLATDTEPTCLRLERSQGGNLLALVMTLGRRSLTAEELLLARYSGAGRPDPAFGKAGSVRLTEFFSRHDVPGMALQEDGRILLAGERIEGSGSVPVLLRLTVDGRPDPSFGHQGFAHQAFPGSKARFGAVAVQRDGRVVAAGGVSAGRKQQLALARYLPDGKPDAAFGKGGTAATPLGDTVVARQMSVLPGGKIVVAGRLDRGPEYAGVLARYLADGTLDRSFGTNGMVTTAFVDRDATGGLWVPPDWTGFLLLPDGSALRGDPLGKGRCRFSHYVLDGG
jgi:uncharacterized delta-60 repeat protein